MRLSVCALLTVNGPRGLDLGPCDGHVLLLCRGQGRSDLRWQIVPSTAGEASKERHVITQLYESPSGAIVEYQVL